MDRLLRLRVGGRLPPRRLLRSVQMTPYIQEYVDIGRRCATGIVGAMASVGLHPQDELAILDFGCGLGRTLRALPQSQWRLHGCDIDSALIAWSRRVVPATQFQVSAALPPLPYMDRQFDLVYAVSVFTHFDAVMQTQWAEEISRVVADRGYFLLTTMGPHAFGSFANLATPQNLSRLAAEGFLFLPGQGSFNSNGAFHTAQGIERFFGASFDLISWSPGGLDGFQDLAILRRRPVETPTDSD
jgi:SAM-dependent methyltransferase